MAGSPFAPVKKRKRKVAKPRPAPLPVDDLLEPVEPGRRVILPFPPAELFPNWHSHWSGKSTPAKDYRRLCWALALEAKLTAPEGDKIAVRLDFFPPDRRSRDDDNVPASFKAGRDGIADALKVDDARFVTTPVLHREPRSCVVVTLENSNHGDSQ